jgi:lipid II:glycine glycyltransferase (peptidoglycan interpeptide bridge formation enzyme)
MNQPHFLQSKAWGAFQEALGKKVFYEQGDGWHYLAILEKSRFNTRLYCPYGPFISKPGAFADTLVSLKQLGRSHSVTFLRMEPTGAVTPAELEAARIQKVHYIKLQPEHTLIVDLSPTEEDLVAAMSQSARNLYRNYTKKGMAIHESHDPESIQLLFPFLHAIAQRNNISLQPDSYLKKQAETLMPLGKASLFYVTAGDTPVAAAFVYDDDTTRYYAHAGANDAYRKLQPGTALVAHMIIDAKRKGLQTFDLSGITLSDDPNHPQAGFTRFKKSFGGTPHHYLGLWELPLQPLRYRFYRLLHSLLAK